MSIITVAFFPSKPCAILHRRSSACARLWPISATVCSKPREILVDRGNNLALFSFWLLFFLPFASFSCLCLRLYPFLRLDIISIAIHLTLDGSKLLRVRVQHDVLAVAQRFETHVEEADAYVEHALSFILDPPDVPKVNKNEDSTLAPAAPSASGTSPSSNGKASPLSPGGTRLPPRPSNQDDQVSLASITASEMSVPSLQGGFHCLPNLKGRRFTNTAARSRRHRFNKNAVLLVRDGYLNRNLERISQGLQHDCTVELMIGTVFRDIMCLIRDIVLGQIATPLSTVSWEEAD